MGAQELEWRVGTQGRSSADQGRDIQAHFHVASPDADLIRQKWWIECKGRKGTVEPSAVKESANNTQAMPTVDVLVIVTNTSFSNPTRNWVSEWQRSHPRPTVKLWDRTHLERFLCRYPAATLRVFAKALTPQGRLEVIRERFWQHSAYATQEHLKELWERRNDLEWESVTLIAAVVSEFANGSVNEHPWLQALECEDFLKLLRIGLASALSFCIRADEAGVDQGPYLDGMGYLVLAALARYPAHEVRSALENFLGIPEADRRRVQGFLLVPIFSRLMASVRGCLHAGLR
jgi:hypothetical protein